MAQYRIQRADHGTDIYEIQYLTPYGRWTWCYTQYSKKEAEEFLSRLLAGDGKALEDTSYTRDCERFVVMPLIGVMGIVILMLLAMASGFR